MFIKSGSLTREFIIQNLGMDSLTAEIARIRTEEAGLAELTILLKKPLAEKLHKQIKQIWKQRGPSAGEFRKFALIYSQFLEKREDYRTALMKGNVSVENFAAFTRGELVNPPEIKIYSSRKRNHDKP